MRYLLCVFLLAACSAPIERSTVERPALPGCDASYTFEVLRQGERVDLYVGDGERLVVIEFEDGELTEDEAPLIEGRARVTITPDAICPAGSIEGDACVVERWESGVCWPVE